MAQRTIKILGEIEDGVVYPPDRARIQECLINLEGALYELGGTVSMSSVRQKVDDDEYVTLGVIITHDTFTPAVKKAPDESE